MHEHHHHQATHEEIAVAAYYLWLAEGCPWGDDNLTFGNWISAEDNLQITTHLPPPQDLE